jgi:hypothetical protein
MSFADRLVAERGHLVHKLKAKDNTGRWAYYFVYVSNTNEAAFMAAIDGDGMIDLEDYGRVIASCYGENPNEETRLLLRRRYGFEV